MKCHDWIFLIFTTIICCTATISIAQAQQRGRVKFALSPQRDETDPIPSPELAPRANRVRTSVPRASTRFRSSEQSSISPPVQESKETPRTPVQRSRSRPINRSSQKLDTEATELVPSIRSRKRGNSVPANDQPTRVQLPTANVERPNVDRPNADRPNADRPNVDRPNVDRPIVDRLNVDRPTVDRPNVDHPIVDRPNVDRPSIDRANIIRQSKSRPETTSSTTSAPSSSTTPHFRRRSDDPIEESSENIRKVRTYSRSVTRRSDSVVSSSEGPLITTARNDWRTAGSRRGSAKAKLSERIPKSLDDEAEDQLEDENYPEHFKILLKKQKPKTHLSPRNLPRPPLPEDPTFSRSNEIYDSTKTPLRPRRLEQTSQENGDEILQVSRAIPKVRRVELKREDTARAALKSRRVEPPSEETKNEDVPKVPSKSRRIDPSISQLLNEDIPRVSFKSRRAEAPSENVSRSSFKSRRNEPLREPPTETKPNDPPKTQFKSRRIEAQPEEIRTEVKPNEIVEPTVKRVKPLFIPRRAEPYRPKPTSSTPRSTTAAKSNRKPENQDTRTKYKPRINNRLQFPSLRSKTTPTPPEDPIKDDNEIVNVRPNPQPIRPPQITKSRNLALDRPIVDTKSKSKTQKFSSRYRGDAFSRYQQKSDTSKPIYTPTIPAVTTEPIPPQSDLPTSRTAKSAKPYNPESHDLIQSDNKYAGVVFDEKAGVWNMVEPIADGLTRSEISVDSVDDHPAQPSVTVSIFEALADILSKTPTTTTTTTTTTTSTTTSTTELPEIIQVPEIKVDSMQISSTTVNTHLITDVDDDYTTTTNEITNFDRNGRILNRVDINQIPSTRTISPFRTSPNPIESSLETTTLTLTTQNTDTSAQTAPNTESETEQELDQTTLLDYTDLTTLALAPSPTQPTYSNTNTELTNSNTSNLELTTFSSIPPTNLPLPHLADALTTPGSSLVTQPQLISAISNFLDTSVQNASDTMATSTTTADITTTTLETNTDTEPINTSDASQTLSPITHTITTRSSSSTESPPVTISFLDLFTIQPKKVNSNTEPVIDIHPIYREPDPTTTPADKNQKTLPPESTTGKPVNIQTFFRTQTYPSITITGGTSTDRIKELSTTFLTPSSEETVTDGVTTEDLIPSTTTHDQDTSTSTSSIDYTTSPQSTQTQSSLPIHLNSILGSTQKYDQTSPTKTTAQTETTTTIRSRFGNNRLPILPAGSGSFNNKPTTSTSTTSTTTTTTTTTSKTTSTSTTAGSSSTSSSVTPPPVRVLPKQRQLSNSTPLPTQQQQEPNVIQDFSIYGILPNNTVVRKRPPEVSRKLDIGIMVYGILPNQTVVRKYPNGTLAIVDSSKDVEVVDIDPKMLFNPFSELYRTSQSSLLLTTHRSTTSHRLIESNDIVSSVPRSSSSTAVPISTTNTIGTTRTGISIKESTDSGNTDATTTNNGDDDNLIQLLNENEDNLLNSTSLVEPNTENAVLLDLLKRKYLNTDLPSKSSNVVSFTTIRNMIEESSIQANKEEDVSENTLLDSSEEKRKDTSMSTSSEEDLLGKLFSSNSPTEPNTDDDNIISHHYDNVERGSIFAGNKGRTLEFSQRTKLYPIKSVMDSQKIENRTTELFPNYKTKWVANVINVNNDTTAVIGESLAEANRTYSVDGSSANGSVSATPIRDGASKIIDFGILESEIDPEGNRDYFMDPDERFEVLKGISENDSVEGSGADEFEDSDEFDDFWTPPPGSAPEKVVYSHNFDEFDDPESSLESSKTDFESTSVDYDSRTEPVLGSVKNDSDTKSNSDETFVVTASLPSESDESTSSTTPSNLKSEDLIPIKVLYPDGYFEQTSKYFEELYEKKLSATSGNVVANESTVQGPISETINLNKDRQSTTDLKPSNTTLQSGSDGDQKVPLISFSDAEIAEGPVLVPTESPYGIQFSNDFENASIFETISDIFEADSELDLGDLNANRSTDVPTSSNQSSTRDNLDAVINSIFNDSNSASKSESKTSFSGLSEDNSTVVLNSANITTAPAKLDLDSEMRLTYNESKSREQKSPNVLKVSKLTNETADDSLSFHKISEDNKSVEETVFNQLPSSTGSKDQVKDENMPSVDQTTDSEKVDPNFETNYDDFDKSPFEAEQSSSDDTAEGSSSVISLEGNSVPKLQNENVDSGQTETDYSSSLDQTTEYINNAGNTSDNFDSDFKMAEPEVEFGKNYFESEDSNSNGPAPFVDYDFAMNYESNDSLPNNGSTDSSSFDIPLLTVNKTTDSSPQNDLLVFQNQQNNSGADLSDFVDTSQEENSEEFPEFHTDSNRPTSDSSDLSGELEYETSSQISEPLSNFTISIQLAPNQSFPLNDSDPSSKPWITTDLPKVIMNFTQGQSSQNLETGMESLLSRNESLPNLFVGSGNSSEILTNRSLSTPTFDWQILTDSEESNSRSYLQDSLDKGLTFNTTQLQNQPKIVGPAEHDGPQDTSTTTVEGVDDKSTENDEGPKFQNSFKIITNSDANTEAPQAAENAEKKEPNSQSNVLVRNETLSAKTALEADVGYNFDFKNPTPPETTENLSSTQANLFSNAFSPGFEYEKSYESIFDSSIPETTTNPVLLDPIESILNITFTAEMTENSLASDRHVIPRKGVVLHQIEDEEYITESITPSQDDVSHLNQPLLEISTKSNESAILDEAISENSTPTHMPELSSTEGPQTGFVKYQISFAREDNSEDRFKVLNSTADLTSNQFNSSKINSESTKSSVETENLFTAQDELETDSNYFLDTEEDFKMSLNSEVKSEDDDFETPLKKPYSESNDSREETEKLSMTEEDLKSSQGLGPSEEQTYSSDHVTENSNSAFALSTVIPQFEQASSKNLDLKTTEIKTDELSKLNPDPKMNLNISEPQDESEVANVLKNFSNNVTTLSQSIQENFNNLDQKSKISTESDTKYSGEIANVESVASVQNIKPNVNETEKSEQQFRPDPNLVLKIPESTISLNLSEITGAVSKVPEHTENGLNNFHPSSEMPVEIPSNNSGSRLNLNFPEIHSKDRQLGPDPNMFRKISEQTGKVLNGFDQSSKISAEPPSTSSDGNLNFPKIYSEDDQLEPDPKMFHTIAESTFPLNNVENSDAVSIESMQTGKVSDGFDQSSKIFTESTLTNSDDNLNFPEIHSEDEQFGSDPKIVLKVSESTFPMNNVGNSDAVSKESDQTTNGLRNFAPSPEMPVEIPSTNSDGGPNFNFPEVHSKNGQIGPYPKNVLNISESTFPLNNVKNSDADSTESEQTGKILDGVEQTSKISGEPPSTNSDDNLNFPEIHSEDEQFGPDPKIVLKVSESTFPLNKVGNSESVSKEFEQTGKVLYGADQSSKISAEPPSTNSNDNLNFPEIYSEDEQFGPDPKIVANSSESTFPLNNVGNFNAISKEQTGKVLDGVDQSSKISAEPPLTNSDDNLNFPEIHSEDDQLGPDPKIALNISESTFPLYNIGNFDAIAKERNSTTTGLHNFDLSSDMQVETPSNVGLNLNFPEILSEDEQFKPTIPLNKSEVENGDIVPKEREKTPGSVDTLSANSGVSFNSNFSKIPHEDVQFGPDPNIGLNISESTIPLNKSTVENSDAVSHDPRQPGVGLDNFDQGSEMPIGIPSTNFDGNFNLNFPGIFSEDLVDSTAEMPERSYEEISPENLQYTTDRNSVPNINDTQSAKSNFENGVNLPGLISNNFDHSQKLSTESLVTIAKEASTAMELASQFSSNKSPSNPAPTTSSSHSGTQPTPVYIKKTVPPAVYYPMKMPKMLEPLVSLGDAAIVMPTNMQAVMEPSTEPNHVQMVFPKNVNPPLNVALPGHFHKMYTKEELESDSKSKDNSSEQKTTQEPFEIPNSGLSDRLYEQESFIPVNTNENGFKDNSHNKTDIRPVPTGRDQLPVNRSIFDFKISTSDSKEKQTDDTNFFIPGGIPHELLSNPDSYLKQSNPLPTITTVSDQFSHDPPTVTEKMFIPGGIPQGLLLTTEDYSEYLSVTQSSGKFDTTSSEHIQTQEMADDFPKVQEYSSTSTPNSLQTTSENLLEVHQGSLKHLETALERMEHEVLDLKETFIKSLDRTTAMPLPLNYFTQKEIELSKPQMEFNDSGHKIPSLSLLKEGPLQVHEEVSNYKQPSAQEGGIIQETLDPPSLEQIKLSSPNFLDRKDPKIGAHKIEIPVPTVFPYIVHASPIPKYLNIKTLISSKNEVQPSFDSKPQNSMTENSLDNMHFSNTTMTAENSNISISKLDPSSDSISNDPASDEEISDSDLDLEQSQYLSAPINQIPQHQYNTKIDVESRTKATPPEIIYSAPTSELSIEASKQNHTETQYTIQQHNYFHESSTISSIENSILTDNLKNSINTIIEPKKVDNKQTPTIYLVTPGTTITTTTPSSTTASTTTTTTTPSTTTSTSSTTPSTTTTTTPSTTTPSTTTTSTTTTTEPPTTTTSTTTTTTEPPTTTTTTTTTTTPIPTTISTTPLTTSTLPSTTVSRQQNLELSELEKNIKLLEQLLALQGSLKRKSTTSTSSSTTTTSSTTPSTSSSTMPATTKSPVLADDAFLNTLRQLLLAQQRTTKKPTTSSSTTTTTSTTSTTTTTTTTTTPKPTTTTTTTIKTPVTISPQNLQDLLNSFSTPSFSTTTSKDDIDFLNSLRDIGRLKVTTSVPPTFANRIIELALQNRQVTPTAPVYIPARVTTTPPPFTPLPEIRRPTLLPSNDVENHRQDQASLSADLSLLSTLLGRRITIGDLPQLTQQFGGNRRPAAPSRKPTPRTTTTTTTSTEKPMTRDEITEIEKNLNLLSSLLGRPVSLNELPLIMQDLRSGRKPKGTAPGARINLISPVAMKTTTTNRPRTTLSVQSQTPISQEEVIELLKDPSFATSPEHLNIYGNSNDAVLAAVLKQRGIGPTHNNIPINDLFLQGPTPTPYRTTRPPPPPPTQPQRRPILDGLAWLWRAWQDTGTGTRTSKNRQPEAAASTRLESPIVIANTAGSGEGGEYADLQYPKNPTNLSLGQGNGLLTAAFGVTRAVTQFLGAAFQGAAQSVQSAFSPQALRQNNLMSLSG